MEKITIRASALGKIMHLDQATKITDKQLQTINELQAKQELSEKGLTENQEKELKRLIAKRDAPPQLSKGAKTYIKDLFFGCPCRP